MKPLILLTAGFDSHPTGQDRFSLYHNYADAVISAGGSPLLALDGSSAKAYAKVCDGLLLTGGVDIHPRYYGEEILNDTLHLDTHRDALELELTEAFVAAGIPILGICRGLQLLNIFFGGSMWQDLPSQKGLNHSSSGFGLAAFTHPVSLAAGSILHQLFGGEILVNTYHHQAIKALGEGLLATAHAGELPEAIEHSRLPIHAVQWHPERMTGAPLTTPDMAPVFTQFIEQCTKYAIKRRKLCNTGSLETPMF